ncbi:MAG: hypothetical protein GY858_01335 [Candidatus Omnitrophica bacterium]|nr:hypothetical protein [Candidatus Omnitrophota bacterium]
MRKSIFNKLVLMCFLVFLSACYAQQKPIAYNTPFGEIEKSSSTTDVMNMLGNPHNVSFKGQNAIWHYYFGDKHTYVYFLNDRVTIIKEK